VLTLVCVQRRADATHASEGAESESSIRHRPSVTGPAHDLIPRVGVDLVPHVRTTIATSLPSAGTASHAATKSCSGLSRIGLRTAARERQATVRRTTPGYFRRVAMNKA
jgi:hypothetical protein